MFLTSETNILIQPRFRAQWHYYDFVIFRIAPCCIFMLLLSAISATGQVPREYETAPPPLRVISKMEQKLLDEEKGIRKRTKLCLELMDARLTQAEMANAKNNLDEMFQQLGGFQALIENALDFLEGKNLQRDKVLDNFKKLEIGLRKFTPRLEILRRDLPLTHEYYVRNLIRQLRDARTRATNPLFSDTVIPNNDSR